MTATPRTTPETIAHDRLARRLGDEFRQDLVGKVGTMMADDEAGRVLDIIMPFVLGSVVFRNEPAMLAHLLDNTLDRLEREYIAARLETVS